MVRPRHGEKRLWGDRRPEHGVNINESSERYLSDLFIARKLII
jgi:hypothetical protein